MREITDRDRMAQLKTTMSQVDPTKQSHPASVLMLRNALWKDEGEWSDAEYICVKRHLGEEVQQFSWTDIERERELFPLSFLHPEGDPRRYGSQEIAQRVLDRKEMKAQQAKETALAQAEQLRVEDKTG